MGNTFTRQCEPWRLLPKPALLPRFGAFVHSGGFFGVLVEQLLQDFAGAEEAGVGPPFRRQSPGKSSCSPQTSDEAFIRQDR